MALDAKINKWSRFDRKNYFYADLPQGYQISQLYHPLVGEGEVEVLVDEKDESSGQAHRHRAHPRRAGRGQADARPASDDELRRPQPLRRRADGDRVAAGHAFASRSRGLSEEAAIDPALRRLVRRQYGGRLDARRRQRQRAQARRANSAPGPRPRTSISVRFVMAVVEHEAKRQVELIESGGTVAQETRLYDPDKNVTRLAAVEGRRARLPLFPRPRSASARARRGVPRGMPLDASRAARRQAQALRGAGHNPLQRQRFDRRGRDRALVRYAARRGRGAEAGRELGRRRTVRRAQPPRRKHRPEPGLAGSTPPSFSGWSPTARFAAPSPSRCSRSCSRPGEGAGEIVEERGLKQTSDTGAIDAEIDKVLAANADKVAEYKSGKEQLFGFFVGQTMKAMAGKANPKLVNERLRAKLG